MEVVLALVNGVGSAVTTSVTTLLSLNHIVVEFLVKLLSNIFLRLSSAVFCVSRAVLVAVEDLGIFIFESADFLVHVFEFIFSVVDTVTSKVIGTSHAIRDSAYVTFANLVSVIDGLGVGVLSVCNCFGRGIQLTGNSLWFLAALIPRLLYFSVINTGRAFAGILDFVLLVFYSAVGVVRSAPTETVLGLSGAVILVVSLYKLFKCEWGQRNLGARRIFHLFLTLLCIVYSQLVKGLLCCINASARMVTFFLTHLHVTRFHHAGDSDNEEVNGEDGNHYVYDNSDTNENDRFSNTRRNYNLLLQRRRNGDRRRERRALASKIVDGKDMEEMLFEQVEREREDKLCVVCHDKDKCIMILPCRHLCICQDCQNILMRHSNHCPICRKVVKQTIKAYL